MLRCLLRPEGVCRAALSMNATSHCRVDMVADERVTWADAACCGKQWVLQCVPRAHKLHDRPFEAVERRRAKAAKKNSIANGRMPRDAGVRVETVGGRSASANVAEDVGHTGKKWKKIILDLFDVGVPPNGAHFADAIHVGDGRAAGRGGLREAPGEGDGDEQIAAARVQPNDNALVADENHGANTTFKLAIRTANGNASAKVYVGHLDAAAVV